MWITRHPPTVGARRALVRQHLVPCVCLEPVGTFCPDKGGEVGEECVFGCGEPLFLCSFHLLWGGWGWEGHRVRPAVVSERQGSAKPLSSRWEEGGISFEEVARGLFNSLYREVFEDFPPRIIVWVIDRGGGGSCLLYTSDAADE